MAVDTDIDCAVEFTEVEMVNDGETDDENDDEHVKQDEVDGHSQNTEENALTEKMVGAGVMVGETGTVCGSSVELARYIVGRTELI